MKQYPSIIDLLNESKTEDSITIKEEENLILSVEELALQIETEEAQAYISATSVILNC